MPIPDPCAEPESPPLSLQAALEHMLGGIRPVEGLERVPLQHALGRVLAEEVLSPADLPPFPNAAMDGFALRAGAPDSAAPLRIIGTSAAGHPFSGSVAAGECVRIFTGAALPPDTDAVVAQENVAHSGDAIRIAVPPAPGENLRPQGDEIRAGESLLPAGKVLAPADLGLLASVGMHEAVVRRRPRVAFFSTGDELRPVWEPLAPGEIHESNRYVLAALLAELGVEILDFGTVPDDPEALRRVLSEAADSADAVITSGGASAGEADFIVRALRSVGRIEFWKVAIKPGKPFAFGRIGPAYLLGLPGNPVSAMVCFRQLARPVLRRLMGAPDSAPLRLHAICTNRLVKRPGRIEFQRGLYRRNPAGGFEVEGLPAQGSHRLTSMSRANCFIVLPSENSGIGPGATVEIEPFDGPA